MRALSLETAAAAIAGVASASAAAMLAPENPLSRELAGESRWARKVRRRILEKARPLNGRGRRLEDADYDYDDAAYYSDQAGDDAYAAQADAYDGGYSSSSNTNYAYNNGGGFAFDPSSYSLAYQSCASVRQFDDALAAQEDSEGVFSTQHFAVVRLCPSSTCEEGSSSFWGSSWSTATSSAMAFQSAEGGGGRDLGSSAASGGEGSYAFERLRAFGANGSGCSSDYAEYILGLGEYLQIMAEFRAERFASYCDACNDCLYAAYESWLNNHRGRTLRKKDIADPTWRDDLDSPEFKEYEVQRKLDDEYDPYALCPEYDTCKYYRNTCRNGDYEAEEVEQYFQCTEAVGDNGYSYYIGPRCSSDGITIKLGVFSDVGCNEYMGTTKVTVASLVGSNIGTAATMAAYASGSLGLTAQEQNGNGAYDTRLVQYYSPSDEVCVRCLPRPPPSGVNDGSSYQDDGYGQLNEVCEALHQSSARCTVNLAGYGSYSSGGYATHASEAADELTCAFIEAIVLGSTDSLGFVAPNNRFEGLVSTSERERYHLQHVSVFQIFGLAATMLACAVLFLWSKSLGHSLRKGPRRPSRSWGWPQDEPTRVGNEYIVPQHSQVGEEHLEVEVLHTNLDNLHREIDELTKHLAQKNDVLSGMSNGSRAGEPSSQGSSGRSTGMTRSRTNVKGRVKKIFGKKAKVGRTVSARDQSMVSDVTF